jgi:hypothetical protein
MDAAATNLPTNPQTACNVLIQCYDDGAGTEALLCAFIAERNRESIHAQFWVGVYRLIVQQSGRLAERRPSNSSQG